MILRLCIAKGIGLVLGALLCVLEAFGLGCLL